MSAYLKSIGLVIAQFACLVYLAATAITSLHDYQVVLLLSAAALMLWAIIAMNKSKLQIFPEPARGSSLVTGGPYRWVRHPMYTALIVGAGALLPSGFSGTRLAVWVTLVGVLVVKLRFEESLLAKKFPLYRQYRKSSYRLIPFVY